ncbi:MAG: substrate-binding domain-containing protein [Ruminococcus sp.]
MKKRVLASLLAGCMVLGSLTACGGGSGTDTSAETSEAEASAEEADVSAEDGASSENQKVTMILSVRDEWLSEMESGALEAAEEMGIDLTTQDAQNDTSKMLQFIETARNDGQKAVIINMVDPETGQECIDAAGDMKVVFVNRYPTDLSLLNENAVYVGSDENQAGDLQAEYLAEYFEKQGKTDIKYILLSGNYGLTATTLRTESVLNGLKERGINAEEATAPLVADYDRATAQDMISPVLTTIDYDCIISNNDSMALGAVEAMTAAGLDPSSVPIVGIDASTDGRKSIADGQMAMSAFQNAVGQGSTAVLAAKNLIEGKPANEGSEFDVDPDNEYITWVPFERVDASNVAEYN